MNEEKMVSADKVRQVLMAFCQGNFGNKLSEELINGLWVRMNTQVFELHKAQESKDEKKD